MTADAVGRCDFSSSSEDCAEWFISVYYEVILPVPVMEVIEGFLELQSGLQYKDHSAASMVSVLILVC
jgi:hypothetical protein